jgi:hypothetical protein
VNLVGFEDDELARLLAEGDAAGLTDEDAVPDPPADPVTSTGNLWLLGPHRVLCGDATSSEAVMRVCGAPGSRRQPLVMITDPPYGIELDSEWRDRAGLNGCGPAEAANNQIAQVFLSGTSSGPAFLGLLWDGTGPQIGKAEILTGNSPIAFGFNQNLPTVDVVALDDFAFAEPQAIPTATPTPLPPSVILTLIGLAMIALFVTTRKFARYDAIASGSTSGAGEQFEQLDTLLVTLVRS